MKSVENQVDSCSSATQDCNASEFVDGDQADSENVTVADGVTFINGVAVSDTNHEKKGGVDMAQKPKQKEQKSEPKVPSVAARTRSALKTGNQEPRQSSGVPPKKSKWCANWISLVILILRLEVYSGYAGTLTSCRLLRSSERASNFSIVIAQHLRILFHLW